MVDIEHAGGRHLHRRAEAIYRFGLPGIMKNVQGSQFTYFVWTDRLPRSGIRISMDGKGRDLEISSSNACGAPETRMRLSACLGYRVAGTCWCPQLDGVLQ